MVEPPRQGLRALPVFVGREWRFGRLLWLNVLLRHDIDLVMRRTVEKDQGQVLSEENPEYGFCKSSLLRGLRCLPALD